MMWGLGYGNSWPLVGFSMGIAGIFFSIIMMLFPIAIIITIVYFIIWVLKTQQGKGGYYHAGNGNGAKEDDHMSILKKRYAKGEITKDQFEEMKKTLKND